MSTVHTIRGPIDSSRLGRTLSHEHLTTGRIGMERLPWVYVEDDCVAAGSEGLRNAKAAGSIPAPSSALDLVKAGYAEQVCLGHDGSPRGRFGAGRTTTPDCWLPFPRSKSPGSSPTPPLRTTSTR